MEYNDRLFAFENVFDNGQMKIDIGEVIQVSELSVISGGEISQHTQVCDEITYAISGSAIVVSGSERKEMKAGQIHFIKKGQIHKIEASGNENFRYICIGYVPDKNNDIVKSLYNSCKDVSYFSVSDNGTVKVLSEFLIREFYNYDEYSEEMINQYMLQILTTIIRICSGKDYVYNRNHSKKSGNHAMYKMLRYIDREYMQITSVKQIAQDLSYSEYYLSHLFHDKMGITLKEYLTKKKIGYAAELIRDGVLTVEQIADRLNFSCPRTFRRAFKQYTGMTPKEYKSSI